MNLRLVGAVIEALMALTLGLALACAPPKVTTDPECLKQNNVDACTAACSHLGGVVVATPAWNGADCLCASSLIGSSAGWDDQRRFKISRDAYVPGHVWEDCLVERSDG